MAGLPYPTPLDPGDAATARWAFRAATELRDGLAVLPLDTAQALARHMLASADRARAERGAPAGLVEVLHHVETIPDFLRSRDDSKRALHSAWCALGADDHAAFLRWAMGARRAA